MKTDLFARAYELSGEARETFLAKVLDAGATATGRPYFAMELVKGVPITRFCDAQGLGTRERLALFRDVCAAINHARQKGVIHRDIKPSKNRESSLPGADAKRNPRSAVEPSSCKARGFPVAWESSPTDMAKHRIVFTG